MILLYHATEMIFTIKSLWNGFFFLNYTEFDFSIKFLENNFYCKNEFKKIFDLKKNTWDNFTKKYMGN